MLVTGLLYNYLGLPDVQKLLPLSYFHVACELKRVDDDIHDPHCESDREII